MPLLCKRCRPRHSIRKSKSLEPDGFDVVKILFSCLGAVNASVDIHRLAFSVSTNVLEDVLFHPLIPHQRREYSTKRVRRELLVEPVLAVFHDPLVHCCLTYRTLNHGLRQAVVTDTHEQVVQVSIPSNQPESLDRPNRLPVDRHHRLLPTLAFAQSDEAVVQHQVVHLDFQGFFQSTSGLRQ